ncbi:PAS domain S-box protein [Candidatus Sumerlaeota bacterium]|nr:PAS domain S-box protein [Candidatus Sumerlaeota bacterium]
MSDSNKPFDEDNVLFRTLMEHSTEAFFLHDAGKILDVNHAACEMLGYTREELLNLAIADIDVRLIPDQHEEIYSKNLFTGKTYTFESALLRKDKTELPVEIKLCGVIAGERKLLLGLARSIAERKKADNAYQRSEFFLSRSQEIGLIGSYVLDIPVNRPEAQTWRSTPMMDKIFGIDADYPKTGDNWLKLIVQRQEVSEYFARQVASGQRLFEMEYQIIRPSDGQTRWIYGRGDFEFNKQGQCTRLVGTVQDITERKQAEEERNAHLRFLENLDRINRVIQSANDIEQMMRDVLDAVLSIFDSDGAFLLFPCDPNAGAWTLPMARSQPDHDHIDYPELAMPIDDAMAGMFRLMQHSDKAVKLGSGHDHETPPMLAERLGIKTMMGMALYPKTGKPWLFAIHQCSSVRGWTDRDETLFLTIGRRLSDALTSLLTLRDLQKSEAFLSSLIDNIPNIIIVKDAQTLRYLRINKSVEQILGFSKENMLGKSVFDIFPEDLAKSFLNDDREVLNSKTLLDIPEETIRDSNNEQRILHTKKIPILDDRGEPQYLLGIAEDITERKKLERQLHQSQKMEAVGQLAGGIAHDFNNMLAVIIGNIEIAMQQNNLDQSLHACLQEIQSAAERSAELTRQLLAFARKQHAAPQVLDLNETINGMLNMLRRLIGENINLAWLPKEKIWPVKMDPTQIDQILANLCVNARDAIEGVGKITIETGAVTFDIADCEDREGFIPGDFVLLTVSDTGHGMDQETQGKIFEPFFTTKEIGKGTGLGLATVYGIVKQNNGFINVYSELKHGTTFRIYLPRHIGDIDYSRQEDAAAPGPRGHETIMIVEDEPAILRMTSLMLTKCGYRVLTAATPSEAIRIARKHAGPIDLLITDQIMPEMHGSQLAKQIQSLCPGIRCLFMSGYTGNIALPHAPQAENKHFIPKPFTVKTFTAKVREALDQ